MIRMDRYTEARWPLVLPETRAEIERRIPEGHDLHIGHGGNRYSASLFRDGTLVAENRQASGRIGPTCLGLLHRFPSVRVTTDAEGWVTDIEEVA